MPSGPGEDPQTMIPKCCCAYHVIRQNAISIVNDECRSRTQMETGDFVADLIKSVVNALTELACCECIFFTFDRST